MNEGNEKLEEYKEEYVIYKSEQDKLKEQVDT